MNEAEKKKRAREDFEKNLSSDFIRFISSELRKITDVQTRSSSSSSSSSPSSSSSSIILPHPPLFSDATKKNIFTLCDLLSVLIESSFIPLTVFIEAHAASVLTEGLFIQKPDFQHRLLVHILSLLQTGHEMACQQRATLAAIQGKQSRAVLSILSRMEEDDDDEEEAVDTEKEIEHSPVSSKDNDGDGDDDGSEASSFENYEVFMYNSALDAFHPKQIDNVKRLLISNRNEIQSLAFRIYQKFLIDVEAQFNRIDGCDEDDDEEEERVIHS